jgi:monoamine oxidase
MATPQNDDLLRITQSGLIPTDFSSKKIIIIGAGIAGLVSAYELKRAGHQVTVLEAQQRVGGRILTLREPFSHGLYGEAGAMRLPAAHKLTQSYIQKFGLETYEFTKGHPRSFVYLNGQKALRREITQDPGCLNLDLSRPNHDQNILQFWDEMIHKTAAQVEADEGYWDELAGQYGGISVYEYFKKHHWPEEAITALAILEGLEPVMSISFFELLQVDVHWLRSRLTQIVGGSDLLPKAFLPELQHNLLLGAEVTALDYTADTVTIHYKDKEGLNQVSGDFAILAIPFPALRFVDVLKSFSPARQMAIRQLHYSDAVKIFLQCRRRFWEEDHQIFGGASVSDLPIRSVFYPEHGRQTGRGVLMGCYTYGEEADRWAALSPEERVAQALKYVSLIHPQVAKEFETGSSKVWSEDRFAGGAFAQFEPGQQARLYPSMITPEGPIYFAGEHVSLKHMWIEGAVESGLRAASGIQEKVIASRS